MLHLLGDPGETLQITQLCAANRYQRRKTMFTFLFRPRILKAYNDIHEEHDEH